jgi:hypothetical protein
MDARASENGEDEPGAGWLVVGGEREKPSSFGNIGQSPRPIYVIENIHQI